MTIIEPAAPARPARPAPHPLPTAPNTATTGAPDTARTIYRTLALVFGAILLLAGVGALWGGRFAESFIAEEMDRQNITMPTEQAIDGQLASGSIDQTTAEELLPYAGVTMANGSHAKAYAGYIQDHMAGAGAAAGLTPEQATYSGVGAVYAEVEETLTAQVAADNPRASEEEVLALVAGEIADPTSGYPAARQAAALDSLRFGTMFNGNMLVGTLLNVYGWGLVGAIATWAGIAFLAIGALFLLGGFLIRPRTTR